MEIKLLDASVFPFSRSATKMIPLLVAWIACGRLKAPGTVPSSPHCLSLLPSAVYSRTRALLRDPDAMKQNCKLASDGDGPVVRLLASARGQMQAPLT